MNSTIKLTVVIAAYNSPPGLDDLVTSLDLQTLPSDQFEVIFVNDGSTDDTLNRLERIAAERQNFRVLSIPNSGWPSKPRNTAIEIALGKYVFFSDHDDYIFPEAFERMIDLAEQTECDVLHPKEVVAGWSAPGWNGWQTPNSTVKNLLDADVQCITPHKMYKTSFLKQNSIAFPEHLKRLEDFSFNAQVWATTNKIATLSDYPCYKWIIYDDNSHKSGYDFDAYWEAFSNSLQPILTLPDDEPKKDILLRRWYKSRILERLGPIYSTYSDKFKKKLNAKFIGLLKFFPPSIDVDLNYEDRLRSKLLRKSAFGSLERLSNMDKGLRLASEFISLEWSNGTLLTRLKVFPVDSTGAPCQFVNVSGVINRALPQEILDDLSLSELTEIAIREDELDAEIVVRDRKSSVDWVLPRIHSLPLLPVDGMSGPVGIEISTLIDPRSAAFGSSLHNGIWDCFSRMLGLGLSATHRIPVEQRRLRPALIDGMSVIPYTTQDGFLALDVGATYRTIVGSAQPKAEDVTKQVHGLRIDLGRVHVAGSTKASATLELSDGTSLPAELCGQRSRAYMTVEGTTDVRIAGSRAVVANRRSAPLFK